MPIYTTADLDRKFDTPARAKPAPRSNPCADDKPACPACGGLQCLCRPRFFPGQLLTDEDLNRLQRYVIEKNKLHARYLHGWGVACGLEVVCDPCTSSRVTVRTGYALSPCGDDIVVCKDHSVNVCELIDRCRPQTEIECDPPYRQAPRECRDGTQDWILAICYDERPSRGVTALTGSTDTPCSSGCGCGGSGSCGCKGGAGCSCGTKSASTTSKKKSYKPQCEPTQICEGYSFKLLPKPKAVKLKAPPIHGGRDLLFAWMFANRSKFGPLAERLLCCVTAALELRTTFEQKYVGARQAVATYEEYLEALREFAADFALHRCGFADKLAEQTKDDYTQIRELRNLRELSEQHKAMISAGLRKLDYTLMDLITECVCSALLPACPEPAPDNCVPLAVLTVRTRDCRVVEICNWEARKLLITWQTVGYWLSWLPWDRLRASIAKLCCAEGSRQTIVWPLMLLVGMALKQARTSSRTGTNTDETPEATEAPAAGAPPAAPAAPPGAPAAPPAAPAVHMMGAHKLGPGDPLEEALGAESLVEHLAGGYERLRTGSLEDAPDWAPLIARFMDGSALAPLAGRAAMKKAELGDLSANLGLDALRKQVADLQATLEGYKTAMDGLKVLVKGKGG